MNLPVRRTSSPSHGATRRTGSPSYKLRMVSSILPLALVAYADSRSGKSNSRKACGSAFFFKTFWQVNQALDRADSPGRAGAAYQPLVPPTIRATKYMEVFKKGVGWDQRPPRAPAHWVAVDDRLWMSFQDHRWIGKSRCTEQENLVSQNRMIRTFGAALSRRDAGKKHEYG